ncbi:MAG: methyltransferase domain-containing protein [Victivallales bacterium]|nr:methyltransferase domain-containing protein [Victivallales bacterium]
MKNEQYWDEIADVYQSETVISTDDFHYGPLIAGDSELELLPKSLAGLDCLEVGCGGAQNSIYLAKHGANCTAVDISEKQLKIARRLAKKTDVDICFLRADMEKMPLPESEQYDIVHSCHAIAFTTDQRHAIHELAACVKAGGMLVVSTVHPLSGGEWVDLEGEDGLLVKDYFRPTAETRELDNGDEAVSRAYPIGVMTEWIAETGLVLERILEPECKKPQNGTIKGKVPYWSEVWEEHASELQRVPYTIIYIARRPAKVLSTPSGEATNTAGLRKMRHNLEIRAKLLRCVRDFFDSHGFMETQTPVRLPAPALEDYIDAEPSGNQWLRTSPELHMKRLLAAGYERIYQLGPCFRMGEYGSRHLPEFQMLEWYRLRAGWRVVQEDAVNLVRHCVRMATGGEVCKFRGQTIDFGVKWEEITVEDAFRKYADMDLDEAIANGMFEEILCEKVEPHLGNGQPTFLTEYPLACSGLSQAIAGRPNRVERWEVYVAGLELGNACTELVDPDEQLRRFKATAQLRANEHREVYPIDEAFMSAIRDGIPGAAGVAIGFDRLVMIVCGEDDIRNIAFI